MKKRTIRVVGDVAYVPLTQGLEAIIDATDAHLVDGHNWCAVKIGRTFYAMRSVVRNGHKRTLYLHRAILGAGEVDHASGDGLDNRRSNLRDVTHGQNMMNTRLSVANLFCNF